MLGILKVKMSLEYPTFETAFESGLAQSSDTRGHQPTPAVTRNTQESKLTPETRCKVVFELN